MRPSLLIALLAACSSTAETKTRVIAADGGDADDRTECERMYARAGEIDPGITAFPYQGSCVILCANGTGVIEPAVGLCLEYDAACEDPEPPEPGTPGPGPADQHCVIAATP